MIGLFYEANDIRFGLLVMSSLGFAIGGGASACHNLTIKYSIVVIKQRNRSEILKVKVCGSDRGVRLQFTSQ